MRKNKSSAKPATLPLFALDKTSKASIIRNRKSAADNGVGICPEKLAEIRQSLEKATQEPHSSIGLCNVNQRIQAYCGSDCGLSISSTEGKGTIVEITLLLSEEITPPLPKKS